jgi:hypothetical protein
MKAEEIKIELSNLDKAPRTKHKGIIKKINKLIDSVDNCVICGAADVLTESICPECAKDKEEVADMSAWLATFIEEQREQDTRDTQTTASNHKKLTEELNRVKARLESTLVELQELGILKFIEKYTEKVNLPPELRVGRAMKVTEPISLFRYRVEFNHVDLARCCAMIKYSTKGSIKIKGASLVKEMPFNSDEDIAAFIKRYVAL